MHNVSMHRVIKLSFDLFGIVSYCYCLVLKKNNCRMYEKNTFRIVYPIPNCLTSTAQSILIDTLDFK